MLMLTGGEVDDTASGKGANFIVGLDKPLFAVGHEAELPLVM